MLTVEVEGENESRPTFALVVAAEASDEAAAAPMPAVWVNYSSRQNTGFVKIDLSGLQQHTFTATDRRATTEMTGVRLDRFLGTAGWYSHWHSSDIQSHYAIEVQGSQSVTTVDLEGVGSFFDRQAWLVPNGSEASLVVVRADGTVIRRVDGVQRIRVSEVK